MSQQSLNGVVDPVEAQKTITTLRAKVDALTTERNALNNRVAELRSTVEGFRRPLLEQITDYHHENRHPMPLRFCADQMCEVVMGWAVTT